jgi:hypothetical protein
LTEEAVAKTSKKGQTEIPGRWIPDKVSGPIVAAGPEEVNATQPLHEIFLGRRDDSGTTLEGEKRRTC